jgi:hypothetical protein
VAGQRGRPAVVPPVRVGGLMRPPATGSETATVKAILDYLHLRGYLAWRQNSRVVMLPGKGGKDRPVRMGGVKGMADIIGCVPWYGCHGPQPGQYGAEPRIGRLLAIECKSETGRPTPEQTAFLAAVVRAGGIAFLARSVRDVQAHGL